MTKKKLIAVLIISYAISFMQSSLLFAMLEKNVILFILFLPFLFYFHFSFLIQRENYATKFTVYLRFSCLFYLAISFFFARSWPAANLPAFLHFPWCVAFEPVAIYRALAKRVSSERSIETHKKRERDLDGREEDPREEFGAASKHPSLRASFMVKLRTNDRVSMRGFSGAKKRDRKKGRKKMKKKTGARKERLSFPKSG